MRQSPPEPYRIEFSDEMLRDLRERLSRTRWPEVPPQEPWARPVELDRSLACGAAPHQRGPCRCRIAVQRPRGLSAARRLLGRDLRDHHSFGAGRVRRAGWSGADSERASLFQLHDADDDRYGDITAINPVVRMWSIFKAIVGTMYNATVVARLVSLYGGRVTRENG
jgi:hypothetical protein